MFDYPFRLPFRRPFSTGFFLSGFGESPPVSDDLLVWLAWEDAASTQPDKWAQPNAENMINTSGDLYAFEETPLGTMEVADTITLPFEVPDDGAHSNDGTCTVTLDTVTNVLTCTVAGTIRNLVITGSTGSTDLEMVDDLEMDDDLEML